MAIESSLLDHLAMQLYDLKTEVSEPGGTFANMEANLKALQEKKKGSTVSAGP